MLRRLFTLRLLVGEGPRGRCTTTHRPLKGPSTEVNNTVYNAMQWGNRPDLAPRRPSKSITGHHVASLLQPTAFRTPAGSTGRSCSRCSCRRGRPDRTVDTVRGTAPTPVGSRNSAVSGTPTTGLATQLDLIRPRASSRPRSPARRRTTRRTCRRFDQPATQTCRASNLRVRDRRSHGNPTVQCKPAGTSDHGQKWSEDGLSFASGGRHGPGWRQTR